MALLQRPPRTAEELALSAPSATPPDQLVGVSEAEWYERVYRGEELPQLTLRAVLMGSLLGFLLSLTNVYIGLKTGWHLGVSLTASILSYAGWNALMRGGLAKTPMGILENNCMQSTASAAGYATGNTLVTAFPALLLLSMSTAHPYGVHLSVWVTMGFVLLTGLLGTVLAIPMKRNLINREQLRFPTGVAAAVTLHGLYGRGDEALKKARALLFAGGVAALIPLLKDLAFRTVKTGATTAREALIPGSSKVFDFLPQVTIAGKSYAMSDFTIKLDHGVALVGAGVLVGLRVSIWMMVGGLALAFLVTPAAMTASWVTPTGEVLLAATKPQTAWKEIGLWLGAPMLVSSGLLSFALGLRAMAKRARGAAAAEPVSEALAARIARTEVPRSWFWTGVVLAGAPLIALSALAFDIPVHYGLLAVAMTFVLCLVAARATGETDITPTGAMGKIMQLTYGVLMPQSSVTNLMTAGLTGASSMACADLLTDLKSGYLLGANPRRQFVAQAMGVFTGAVASVAGFHLLVPDARVLVGEGGQDPAFPAPAAQQWKAVAELFRLGLDHFHPLARQCIAIGVALGIVFVLLERSASPAMKRYLPSATGLGLGLILPFYYPLAMFLGALLGWLAERFDRGFAELYTIPIASGIIAGESIMGVAVAALNTFVFAP